MCVCRVCSGLACSQLFIAELLKEYSTFETFRNKICSRYKELYVVLNAGDATKVVARYSVDNSNA